MGKMYTKLWTVSFSHQTLSKTKVKLVKWKFSWKWILPSRLYLWYPVCSVWKNKGVKLVLWEHRTSRGWVLLSAVKTSHLWRKVELRWKSLRWKDSCQLGWAEGLLINIAHRPAECWTYLQGLNNWFRNSLFISCYLFMAFTINNQKRDTQPVKP